jgi:hypothetical protein
MKTENGNENLGYRRKTKENVVPFSGSISFLSRLLHKSNYTTFEDTFIEQTKW